MTQANMETNNKKTIYQIWESENRIKVVVVDIKYDLVQETAEELEHGLALEVDVTDFDQCQKMAEKIIAEFGRIDILVANAGIVIGLCAGEW